MPTQEPGNSAPEPNGHKVQIGDPIDVPGRNQIHRVVGYVRNEHQSGERWVIDKNVVTACGLETSMFRDSYPTFYVPCPKCWPELTISWPLHRPRLLVDNTRDIDRNRPF